MLCICQTRDYDGTCIFGSVQFQIQLKKCEFMFYRITKTNSLATRIYSVTDEKYS